MKKKRKKGSWLIRMGVVLLLCAAALAAYNLYDAYCAQQAASSSVGYLETLLHTNSGGADGIGGGASDVSMVIPPVEAVTPEPETAAQASEPTPVPTMVPMVEVPDYILNPQMQMPTVTYEGEKYIGMLEIPALDLKLPIMEAWSYPRLKKAPCRYVGSPYTQDLVIAAHNYPTHFGNLKKLNAGAAVIFTDMDGNVFNYRVELIETLKPGQIDYMLSDEWDLSLFTCTPGGSYRVTVRCTQRMK